MIRTKCIAYECLPLGMGSMKSSGIPVPEKHKAEPLDFLHIISVNWYILAKTSRVKLSWLPLCQQKIETSKFPINKLRSQLKLNMKNENWFFLFMRIWRMRMRIRSWFDTATHTHSTRHDKTQLSSVCYTHNAYYIVQRMQPKASQWNSMEFSHTSVVHRIRRTSVLQADWPIIFVSMRMFPTVRHTHTYSLVVVEQIHIGAFIDSEQMVCASLCRFSEPSDEQNNNNRRGAPVTNSQRIQPFKFRRNSK